MRTVVFAVARIVLRATLPSPDLWRRVQVRRLARALATREPWPRDEAAVTGDCCTRLAMLRLLALQRATRRAVRTRQRESAALLARTAIETCIVGLWCLHDSHAVRKLRESEIKVAPALLTFMSSTGLIPDTVIRQALHALGEPSKLTDLRSMTQMIDSRTGASLAIYLYDLAYRPASQYFAHASSAALLRHVTADNRYRTKPANSWARRAPVRLTDACVGLLAAALANHTEKPTELFVQYSENHARRVLPPALVTISKAMARRLRIADLVAICKQAGQARAELADPRRAPDDRELRLRAMYDALIDKLDVSDLPDEAIQPIIDHLVTYTVACWDAEHANQLPRQSSGADPAKSTSKANK